MILVDGKYAIISLDALHCTLCCGIIVPSTIIAAITWPDISHLSNLIENI